MDNLNFVFHVCKKTEFFKDVYVSPPYSNGDLCRDEANKKRAEYGKDYDVYYTTLFNNQHSQAEQELNLEDNLSEFCDL